MIWIKKLLLGFLLLTSSLFSLEYYTDGKPIYEPMDITVLAISDDDIVKQPINVAKEPINVTKQPISDTIMVVQPMLDSDNDSIVDIEDNCVHISNPNQKDFDGDGQGDSCDIDDDNDGLPDSFENQYTLLNPYDNSDALIDSDGDGITNLDEYKSGTSITQAESEDDNPNIKPQNLETFRLKKGWNLLGINQKLTIDYLKNAVGGDNLLIIKREGKTYYEIGKSYKNKILQEKEGYWIKVARDVNIKYKKILSKGVKKVVLKAGWNLINPLQKLTLQELKNQLGKDNLLVIQNANSTYKKSYLDLNMGFLNNFVKFEKNSGYWIKVAKESILTYRFEGIDIESKDIEITTGSTIHLDGTIAQSEDRNITLYQWYEGNTLLCEETNSTCNIESLEVGTHIITLKTTDEKGEVKSEDITVTVSEDLTKTINENGSSSTVNFATNDDIGEMLPEDVVTTTPSGLTQKISFESDLIGTKDNPSYLTIRSLLNDKATTTSVDYDNGIKVKTTPEGRVIKEIFDTDTKLLRQIKSGNLYPIYYTYNDKNKVSRKSVGNRFIDYTYTLRGKVKTITDALGRKTEIKYTFLHNKPKQIIAPDGSVTKYKYSLISGNMIRLTTAMGKNHYFEYNKNKQITQYTSPLNKITKYIYVDKNLKEKILPSGEKIVYNYVDNQLKSVSTPEGIISYKYINDDLVKSVTREDESISYEYDGTLLTKIDFDGTLDKEIDFTYNNDFRVSSITYGQKDFIKEYDNDGLLTKYGDFTINRDAENGLVRTISDATFTLSRATTGYGEVDKETTNINSNKLFSYEILSRDKTGKITQKKEIIDGEEIIYSYKYDLRGRLVSVKKDGVEVEAYSYDANGNRVLTTSTQREIQNQVSSSNDDDGFSFVGDTQYVYDDNGFLSQKISPTGTTTLKYESNGALSKYIKEDGTEISYINDPLGRRIVKKIDGIIVEKYLWKDMTTLLAVYDENDNLKIRFEYADNRLPYKMIKNNREYYLSYNQVGSLRAVFDVSGNLVKKIEYDSYGNILQDSNPSFDIPIGFAGGLYDKDTKLVRFGYRDYEAYSGKWTAKDPIGFEGGDTNLYAYVGGDPVNFVDPEGKDLAFSLLHGTFYGIIYMLPVSFIDSIFNSIITGNNVSLSSSTVIGSFIGGFIGRGGSYFKSVTGTVVGTYMGALFDNELSYKQKRDVALCSGGVYTSFYLIFKNSPIEKLLGDLITDVISTTFATVVTNACQGLIKYKGK